jgi:methylated-DNA-[protein]-cysteine S-methyltransferase
MTYYTFLETPVGTVMLTGDGTTLHAIYWEVYKHTPAPDPTWIQDRAIFDSVIRQLDDYFAGDRTLFDVAQQVSGTPFQKRVWAELSTIGFGETRTYQQIADAIGAPKAVRAVANAIGRNPLSIIVPCHRVIGSNGSLTGFAGGVESKRALLKLEGAL